MAEVVQALGSERSRDLADGELTWSALGWRGSVLLRLRAHAAGRIDRTACSRCGRTTPRVRIIQVG
jgi:hypothetical protein